MSGGGCSTKGPVKIVIINTQYVETDATSFKSVVQKLTGKESDHHHSAMTEEAAAKAVQREKHNSNGRVVEMPAAATATGGGGGFGNSFMMRDNSFKEFDRLLSQMVPINDDNLW